MEFPKTYVKNYQVRLNKAAQFLKDQFGKAPSLAMVLGSGLGGKFLVKRKPVKSISYQKVPHFGEVSVEGHEGHLHLLGSTKKKNPAAVVLEGRLHYYEGYSPQEIVFPLQALNLWGVGSVLLTNSSGALNPKYKSGDLVLIKGHLNMTGVNPLRGPNLDFLGERFPDLAHLYQGSLSKNILQAAKAQNIKLKRGVYVGLAGPSYETPAEVKAYHQLGGDLVGMSTVLEAIAATHAGMDVAGIGVIVNSCHELSEGLSHDLVLREAKKADLKLSQILQSLIGNND